LLEGERDAAGSRKPTPETATARPSSGPAGAPQLDLFAAGAELERYLAALDVDAVSPREALQHLYELARLADPAGVVASSRANVPE